MPVSGSYHYPSVALYRPASEIAYSGSANAKIDKTGHFVNMSYAHHRIHEGRLNIVPSFSGSIAQNQYVNWLFKTPAVSTGYVHFNCFVSVDSSAKIEFYESASITSSGSQLSARNANRGIAADTSCLCFLSAAIAQTGALLDIHYAGTAGQGQQLGGAGVSELDVDEFILLPSTNYVLRITALAAAGANAAVNFRYYVRVDPLP